MLFESRSECKRKICILHQLPQIIYCAIFLVKSAHSIVQDDFRCTKNVITNKIAVICVSKLGSRVSHAKSETTKPFRGKREMDHYLVPKYVIEACKLC